MRRLLAACALFMAASLCITAAPRPALTPRTAVSVLLVATGWADSVVTYASGPPSLSLAFGGEDGFKDLRVTVNGNLYIITPDEIEAELKGR